MLHIEFVKLCGCMCPLVGVKYLGLIQTSETVLAETPILYLSIVCGCNLIWKKYERDNQHSIPNSLEQ